MAIIQSKVLGLYVLNTADGQTDPFTVIEGANLAAFTGNTATGVSDLTDGTNYIGVNGNTFIGVFEKGASSSTAIDNQLSLQLAATNTSMDISNTVNEVVARDGEGGSETYIVSGAQTWSFSGDGFLTDNANDKVHDIWTSSSGSKYVVVKFDTDVTNASSRAYVGQGLIETFSLSGGFDDNVSYSVSVSGYGKLYTYTS